MPAQHTEWTAEMVRALPDDGTRRELLDGELLFWPVPSMNHQRVVFLLARILDSYVRTDHLGEVFIAPTDVEFSPKRLLQPDVFDIPPTPGRRPMTFQEVGRLMLAAEVLSPATARAVRTKKRDILKDERVPEFWIVDADGRVIERWTPDDERCHAFRPESRGSLDTGAISVERASLVASDEAASLGRCALQLRLTSRSNAHLLRKDNAAVAS